jgi:hypothetical protein
MIRPLPSYRTIKIGSEDEEDDNRRTVGLAMSTFGQTIETHVEAAHENAIKTPTTSLVTVVAMTG